MPRGKILKVFKMLVKRVRGPRKGSTYMRYFKNQSEVGKARQRALKRLKPTQRIDVETAREVRRAIRKRARRK